MIILNSRAVADGDKVILKQDKASEESIVSSLSERIVGQESAKKAIARTLVDSRNPLFAKKGPLATMLFHGPTASGKTQIVKELANLLYNNRFGYSYINGESYQHNHEGARLFGSPPGYIGYDDEPEFSQNKLYKPYNESKNTMARMFRHLICSGIILIDEIEKIHPSIHQSLLGAMDEGVIKLANGKEVDISNFFIIMTSNVGQSEIRKNNIGFVDKSGHKLESSINDLFSPEFLSRLDYIIKFDKLNYEQKLTIADNLIKSLLEEVEELYPGLKLEFSNKVSIWLLEQCNNNKGIRDIEKIFFRRVQNYIGRIISDNYLPEGEDTMYVDIQDNKPFIYISNNYNV